MWLMEKYKHLRDLRVTSFIYLFPKLLSLLLVFWEVDVCILIIPRRTGRWEGESPFLFLFHGDSMLSWMTRQIIFTWHYSCKLKHIVFSSKIRKSNPSNPMKICYQVKAVKLDSHCLGSIHFPHARPIMIWNDFGKCSGTAISNSSGIHSHYGNGL